MKWLKRIGLVLAILLIVYFADPTPAKPHYYTNWPIVPTITELDQWIAQKEGKHHLRKDNEARIVWADSIHRVTPYALVYLHGFSASQEEGDPVHRDLARRFGCNLYLSRLSEHGIDTSEQLLRLSADSYWESAKEALAIGTKLGEKVVLIGTSTDGTQALQLAAAFPDKVAALILYSPNIAINDPNAWILNNPWGLQIARLVKGSDYNDPEDERPIYRQYWNKPYRLEAATALEEMLETTMLPETFEKIHQPVLMLYYYKDEANQDKVVKVSAMKEMFVQLGTLPALKREKAMPLTGNHVIASPIKSKDVEGVERETVAFLKEVMHWKEK